MYDDEKWKKEKNLEESLSPQSKSRGMMSAAKIPTKKKARKIAAAGLAAFSFEIPV